MPDLKVSRFEELATRLVTQFNFAVFPLNGKMPAISKKNGGKGCRDATKDLEQIRRWGQEFPRANVGIATGPASGVVVIDIDDLSTLEQLDLAPTFTVRTGKGLHYYYRTNGHAITNRAKGMPKGVDVRGDGGYVVAFGSVHPDTRQPYAIEHDAPIENIPKSLLQRLLPPAPPTPSDSEIRVSNPQRYVQKVLEAACREIEVCSNRRNMLLNRKAYLVGRFIGPYLSELDAADALVRSGVKSGLTEDESIRAVKNGLTDGQSNAKAILVDPRPFKPTLRPQADLKGEFVWDCLQGEEMGDASLFRHLTQGQKLYDHYANCWLTYYEGRWQRDHTKQTIKECHDLLRSAYLDLSARIDELAVKARREDKEEDAKRLEKRRDKLRDRCKKLGGSGRLRNVLELASGLSSALSTEFDTDAFLLNLRNGTYDLRRGVFRQHQPEDMITKMAHVHFNPDAICPMWMLFLFEICQDDWDLVEYLQKIAGLLLSGRSDYQYLFFLYGKGANGKSTLIKVWQQVLSEFSVTIPIDTLLSKQKSASDEYHLARLKGARMAVSSEIPSGRRLNESLIKDLTSNDPIIARSPYEEPFQYDPTHKLILVGNHKPAITGLDHGIWRRIRIFPFEYTFPEDKRRPMEEVLKEFRDEASGILNWMIEGYRLVVKDGLDMPDAVKKATEEYRQESDSIQAFLDEQTLRTTYSKVPLKDLWQSYTVWCETNGERRVGSSNREFAAILREKGLDVKAGAKGLAFVYGLELKGKEAEG